MQLAAGMQTWASSQFPAGGRLEILSGTPPSSPGHRLGAGPGEDPLPGRPHLAGPSELGGGGGAGEGAGRSSLTRLVQSFNSYITNEHSRLLLLWRQVVGVRRLVSEVKMSTER